ncbi:MAG: PepSY-like domain-containing protein [Cytophagales bacterium]|nr:PepSY-like domain-containing protein [Cytophagales bacterium]
MIKKIVFIGILMSSLACGNENKEKKEVEDQEFAELSSDAIEESDNESEEETEIPNVVKTSLEKAYPNASDVEWSNEGKDFEASFENGKEELSVVFDGRGNILETEKEVEVSELPEKIKAALNGKKVSEAAIISKNGETFYEAEVAGKDLFFDAMGIPAKL